MPKNKNIDLHNHLFEVLERLKDGEISHEDAKAITGVATSILDVQRIENENKRITMEAVKLIADHNGLSKRAESTLLGEQSQLSEMNQQYG